MNKGYRQSQILKAIRAQPIHTQDELARVLGRLKISATQVTLSRDIRDLGLVKTPNGYAPVGADAAPVSTRPDVEAMARELLLDVRLAQNLLVLKTPPANANALAAALDHADWPEVTGTLAGDDTVLVVAPDAAKAKSLYSKFIKFLK
jgi:transcriptional regulator of arginine metabolism